MYIDHKGNTLIIAQYELHGFFWASIDNIRVRHNGGKCPSAMGDLIDPAAAK